jgi:putative membrane protein
MSKSIELGKKMDKWAIGVSVFVLIAVVALRYLPAIEVGSLPFDIHILPALHALLNSLTAIALVLALWFVKNKNIKMHQTMIYTAMALSALFLVSYVVYHFLTEPTKFGGEGAIRMVYFILLASHIILAAVILPFILFTFIRGYTMQIEAHKRIAKWTFPLWLYVAVTGPICYFMLMPYYS